MKTYEEIWSDAVKVATNHAYETVGSNVMIYPCGFAWVNVKRGDSKFAKWLKENGYARNDSYYKGVTIWIGGFNQSYSHKLAYAEKFAEILREHISDCTITVGDRLD